MFMVVNKDKIISYVVSLSTVAILFVMSFVITENKNELVQTSVNLAYNNSSENVVESINDTKTSIKKLD